MPRLVAFGCSYTFGEGLPDTYPIPELHKDRVPSLQAWPAHLGKKLNLESINYGWGGSGNAEILLRLLKTKIYSDDIVVIQWSHFTRLDFYQIVNKYGDGQRVYESGATYNKHKLLVAKMKLEDKFWIENMFMRNWLVISHANHYLRMKNVKNFFFLNTSGWEAENPPEFLDVTGHIKIGPEDYVIDKAFDRSHFGTESHKLLADLLYNNLIHELR